MSRPNDVRSVDPRMSKGRTDLVSTFPYLPYIQYIYIYVLYIYIYMLYIYVYAIYIYALYICICYIYIYMLYIYMLYAIYIYAYMKYMPYMWWIGKENQPQGLFFLANDAPCHGARHTWSCWRTARYRCIQFVGPPKSPRSGWKSWCWGVEATDQLSKTSFSEPLDIGWINIHQYPMVLHFWWMTIIYVYDYGSVAIKLILDTS